MTGVLSMAGKHVTGQRFGTDETRWDVSQIG